MSLDLSLLNLSQREAVLAPAGPTLIIAGPGTGKTHTLAYRIAYVLQQESFPLPAILAVTFTQKAAQEMSERVAKLLSGAKHYDRLWIGTFHKLGLNILRQEGYRIGLTQDFHLLSEPEQVLLVKDVLPGVLPCEPLSRASTWVRRISEHKNQAPRSPRHAASGPDVPEELFAAYEQRLADLHLLDFDDLIIKTLFLLQEYPAVRNHLRGQIGHVLVDEYQDINADQYCLLKELCGDTPAPWVIGDADQAIYAFRGAQVEYFLRFKEDFSHARTITLKENYRSAPTILRSAQAVIARNINRFTNELIPTRSEDCPCIRFAAPSDRAEARLVVNEIERLVGGVRMESSCAQDENYSFNDIAILYRLHHLARQLVEALQQSGIPFQVVGGPRSEPESLLQRILPLLKAACNPHDDRALGAALSTLENTCTFSLIARLAAAARKANCSLYCYLNPEQGGALRDDSLPTGIPDALSLIRHYHEQGREEPITNLLRAIVQDLAGRAPSQGADADTILAQLLFLAEPYTCHPAGEQLAPFLEAVALWKEGEAYNPKAEAVTLMTVHAAKGLEFPVVFLVGLESGIFPYTEFGENPADIEEERRLFYVGMTRAKRRLYLSSCRSRYLFGEKREASPSLFIQEIPEEFLHAVPDPQEQKTAKKPKANQRSLF